MKTFLQDAADAGARFVVGARAERILDRRRARDAACEATVTHADGSTHRADRATRRPSSSPPARSSRPALLLRSGIGGPAAGKHLRLHPASLVGGVYEQPIEGWIGQIQSALSDEFKQLRGRARLPDRGHHRRTGDRRDVAAVAGRARAQAACSSRNCATSRRSSPSRATTARARSRSTSTAARSRAGPSTTSSTRACSAARWSSSPGCSAPPARRRSSPSTSTRSWLARGRGLRRVPRARSSGGSLRANDIAAFTAHQMGSCRMGSDPGDSVADGRGELHDTKGVWIGDALARSRPRRASTR